MSAQARGKAKEKPIASLLAGATAGGVEAFITFPLESIKTQLQFGALDGGKVGFARRSLIYIFFPNHAHLHLLMGISLRRLAPDSVPSPQIYGPAKRRPRFICRLYSGGDW